MGAIRPGSGGAATVADGSVTLAKLADLATDRLIGRSTAGTGVPEAIPCTAAGRALLDDADAAAQRATLGGRVIDPMTGSGWTDAPDVGGATVTWASSKVALALGDGVTGTAKSSKSSYLPEAESYDFTVRLDVVTGDGVAGANGLFAIYAGQSADDNVQVTVRLNTQVEVAKNTATVYAAVSSYGATNIDATARTGGNLHLRISRRPDRLSVLWGTGATIDAVTWVLHYTTSDVAVLTQSQGRFVRVAAVGLAVAGGYAVDVTAIRATGQTAGAL